MMCLAGSGLHHRAARENLRSFLVMPIFLKQEEEVVKNSNKTDNVKK